MWRKKENSNVASTTFELLVICRYQPDINNYSFLIGYLSIFLRNWHRPLRLCFYLNRGEL